MSVIGLSHVMFSSPFPGALAELFERIGYSIRFSAVDLRNDHRKRGLQSRDQNLHSLILFSKRGLVPVEVVVYEQMSERLNRDLIPVFGLPESFLAAQLKVEEGKFSKNLVDEVQATLGKPCRAVFFKESQLEALVVQEENITASGLISVVIREALPNDLDDVLGRLGLVQNAESKIWQFPRTVPSMNLPIMTHSDIWQVSQECEGSLDSRGLTALAFHSNDVRIDSKIFGDKNDTTGPFPMTVGGRQLLLALGRVGAGAIFELAERI